MNYAIFMGCCLPGVPLAFAMFFLLGAKRRAWIRPRWWLSLILGFLIALYGLFNSTLPSFSTPVTAVGKAYDHVWRGSYARHGNHYEAFRFLPEGGQAINIETRIGLPNVGTPTDFDGRTLRVVYLKDSYRALQNEAVDITILSGKNTGFHDSLDARPFGLWLAMPIGFAFVLLGYLLFYYGKGDAKSVALDEGDNPST